MDIQSLIFLCLAACPDNIDKNTFHRNLKRTRKPEPPQWITIWSKINHLTARHSLCMVVVIVIRGMWYQYHLSLPSLYISSSKIQVLQKTYNKQDVDNSSEAIQDFLDNGGDIKPSEYPKSKALNNEERKGMDSKMTLCKLEYAIRRK